MDILIPMNNSNVVRAKWMFEKEINENQNESNSKEVQYCFLMAKDIKDRPKPQQLSLGLTLEERVSQKVLSWAKIVEYRTIVIEKEITSIGLNENLETFFSRIFPSNIKVPVHDKFNVLYEALKNRDKTIIWEYAIVLAKNKNIIFFDQNNIKGVFENSNNTNGDFEFVLLENCRFNGKFYLDLSSEETMQVNGWNLLKEKFQRFLKEEKF